MLFILNSKKQGIQLRKPSSIALTLSHMTILHPSKLIELADDNFKFYEKGGILSERIENAVGKGEIAHYEQFLLPQSFQKTCTADT